MESNEQYNAIVLSDLLSQIKKLDTMIHFHRQNSNDLSTISQYEALRERQINQLNEVLEQFHLKAVDA